MSFVVRTEALTKEFHTGFWRRRPNRALDGLTCDIPAGGVFGLLGPNGAGKSTTLKLLTGLLNPTSGRAELLGQPPGNTAARERLGFLPEHPTFYDHLTAEELIGYFAGLCGISGVDRTRRVTAVLDRVGLGADRRRPIRQYSKGMVQRVGLAQALVNEPELVILDEPMSGLDPVGRRDVRELILELRDEGRTVLFSSHILSDAEQLCSRVGILVRGRLQASGTVGDLTTGESRGWEVVMAAVSPEAVVRVAPRVHRSREIADRRYSFELTGDGRPEPLDRGSIGDRRHPRLGRALAHDTRGRVPSRARKSGRAGRGGRAIDLMSAPRRIGLVAWHVFKENVRDRVLYAIGAFALALVATSLLIGQITAGEDVKIIKDFGLAVIELAGILMTVFIGVGLVAREIDRRSIFSLLAKPLPRWEFIVGKYAGLVMTVLINVVAMAAALYVMLAVLDWRASPTERLAWDAPAVDPRLMLVVVMISAELALLTAVALFFSAFSSSGLLSMVFTLGLFVTGLFSADLRHFGDAVDVSPAIAWVVGVAGWSVRRFLPSTSRRRWSMGWRSHRGSLA